MAGDQDPRETKQRKRTTKKMVRRLKEASENQRKDGKLGSQVSKADKGPTILNTQPPAEGVTLPQGGRRDTRSLGFVR